MCDVNLSPKNIAAKSLIKLFIPEVLFSVNGLSTCLPAAQGQWCHQEDPSENIEKNVHTQISVKVTVVFTKCLNGLSTCLPAAQGQWCHQEDPSENIEKNVHTQISVKVTVVFTKCLTSSCVKLELLISDLWLLKR